MSYRFYFVTLAGAPAMRWMRRIHDTFGRVLDFGQDRSILDQMGAIVSTQDLSPGLDRYQASAMLYALLMQIHSVLMRSKIQRTSRVHQAMSMIDERSGDPRFNVLTIARMLDCSREHLARQFQQATGMTAVSYLSQYRLRRAAELLRQGDAKLDVIARESGFSGANYLCRLFRQKWGVTPAQYRSTPGMVLLP